MAFYHLQENLVGNMVKTETGKTGIEAAKTASMSCAKNS